MHAMAAKTYFSLQVISADSHCNSILALLQGVIKGLCGSCPEALSLQGMLL